ncbi:hypothetical protein CLPU_22c00090 [Gottschalkia purinilytica]|uniref:DUF3848 domain-containing protein n=1 Tax=Gottschalkia purinilytica TaxID=1503 RepID=A0A0L0W6P7_GOTPU|nr:hypothetical protein [Gottschalkia purinilytica]KNF07157.1 hypothetical protein CLPU_22c00090 [Gottschalkia purinilytica]
MDVNNLKRYKRKHLSNNKELEIHKDELIERYIRNQLHDILTVVKNMNLEERLELLDVCSAEWVEIYHNENEIMRVFYGVLDEDFQEVTDEIILGELIQMLYYKWKVCKKG